MYCIENRVSIYSYICILYDNLSWNIIENEINNMNEKYNDDNSYIKVNNSNHIDPINYQLCTNSIIENILFKLHYERDEQTLFSFYIDDFCKITNYSYLTIFFGPQDNKNFFDKNQKIYDHILKMIEQKINLRIFMKIELNNKTSNKIKFSICKKT